MPSPKTQLHQVPGPGPWVQGPETPGPSPVEEGAEETEMKGVVVAGGEVVENVGFQEGNDALGLRRGAVVARGMCLAAGAEERGKVVASIGFREECGERRDRVPGHWSHVLTV